MIERISRYKTQALQSIRARAKDPNQLGIRTVPVSPHDLLKLIDAFEQVQQVESQDATKRSDSALNESASS